jgi:hypothetical protein
MDSWYATKDLMLHIDRAEKFFYCPLKSNRKIDDSGGTAAYKGVEKLSWSDKSVIIKTMHFVIEC